jgi:hypothetical protein
VRLESPQRVLWAAEAWEVRRPDGAPSALDAHGFAADPDAALASMTAAEAETLILHELASTGRRGSSARNGNNVAGCTSRRAELFARGA